MAGPLNINVIAKCQSSPLISVSQCFPGACCKFSQRNSSSGVGQSSRSWYFAWSFLNRFGTWWCVYASRRSHVVFLSSQEQHWCEREGRGAWDVRREEKSSSCDGRLKNISVHSQRQKSRPRAPANPCICRRKHLLANHEGPLKVLWNMSRTWRENVSVRLLGTWHQIELWETRWPTDGVKNWVSVTLFYLFLFLCSSAPSPVTLRAALQGPHRRFGLSPLINTWWERR